MLETIAISLIHFGVISAVTCTIVYVVCRLIMSAIGEGKK